MLIVLIESRFENCTINMAEVGLKPLNFVKSDVLSQSHYIYFNAKEMQQLALAYFFKTVIKYSLCSARTQSRTQKNLSFVQYTEGYIMSLKGFDIDTCLPIKSQLRPYLNMSHTPNKLRPRHKISIFAFVVLFAFENKH